MCPIFPCTHIQVPAAQAGTFRLATAPIVFGNMPGAWSKAACVQRGEVWAQQSRQRTLHDARPGQAVPPIALGGAAAHRLCAPRATHLTCASRIQMVPCALHAASPRDLQLGETLPEP